MKLKQKRGFIIGAALAGALATTGGAFAAIPDSTSGTITSCYDSQGYVRVVDAATTSTCPTGTSKLQWNQQGRTGPTGPRGPQGQPGPGDMHWVKTDASGNVLGKSDSGMTVYTGAGYVYFSVPNVDPSKCAITAQATAMFTDGPITTGYQLYSGYVYVRAQQQHPNVSTPDWYPKTGFDVVLDCGQVY
jgi:hypothetical protein